jgi:hypothetical protein
MPNHVANKLIFRGDAEALELLKERMRAKDGSSPFTFNGIVPMPESVKNTSAGSQQEAGIIALTGRDKGGKEPWIIPYYEKNGIYTPEQLKKWLEQNDPKALEFGEASLVAYKEIGYYDWYDWSIANWGTKWDAYQETISEQDGTVIYTFQTAWSPPSIIIELMSKILSNLEMEHRFCCEGPEFWGRATYRGGEIQEESYDSPEEKKSLYEELWGYPLETSEEEED